MIAAELDCWLEDGDIEGEEGVVLSLDDVGDVVAVDDDDDDGDRELAPSMTPVCF